MALNTYVDATMRIDSPAQRAAVVSPSDTNDLAFPARALWIGTQGDVKVTTFGGDTVVIPSVVGLLPVQVSRVWSTSTTASGIVALA